MNDDESRAYDEAMRQGKYLTGLDIMLKAQAREEGRDTSDEAVYAPIMDNIFWWSKPKGDTMPIIPSYIPKESIIRQDDYATIEVTPGGPMLLKAQPHPLDGYSWEFAGDVQQEGDEYLVLVTMLYDPETDSDMRVVSRHATQEEAIEKLWSLR